MLFIKAVGTRLHQCGRSTVPQLMAALKAELRRKNSSDATKCSISLSSFSLAGVRDCLFVLMQHHLVTFAEDGSQFIYQLNVPAVMEMLRYPRIIEFTKMKFGELVCCLDVWLLVSSFLGLRDCIATGCPRSSDSRTNL